MLAKQINKVLLCSSLVPDVIYQLRQFSINLGKIKFIIKNENRQIVSVLFVFNR